MKTKYKVVSKIRQLIFRNYLNGAGILIKSSTLKQLHLYDEKLRSCEDYDLYLRLLRNNYKIIIIKKPLYLYYFSKNSLSRDFNQISKYELEVLNKNKLYCKNFSSKYSTALTSSLCESVL